MKYKRLTAFILVLIFILGATAVLPVSAGETDTAPTGADAVIKLYNYDALYDTVSCNVGDILTVNVYLDTSDIDGGKISGVMGEQTYTDSVVSILDDDLNEMEEEDSFEYDSDDTPYAFPVMGNLAMGFLSEYGYLYFMGSSHDTNSPFVFDSPDSKLLVTHYKVTSAGEAEIRTELETLALSDLYLTKIIDRKVIKQGYDFDFSSGFGEDTPHALTHYAENAPTPTADGNTEYWICENCGAYFADANGETEILPADTVIAHQCIKGNTISLKDEIGVNFYMFIPDYFDGELAADFSWGSGDYQREAQGTLKPVNSNGANFMTSCPVAARSMTDKVHMSLTEDGTEILTYDFSICDYAKNASEYYADRADLKALLCYMLEYGAAVQRYFGYKTSGENADVADSYIDYVDSDWESHRSDAPASLTDTTDMDDKDFSDYGVRCEGTRLVTTSKTAIRLFFSIEDDDLFASTHAYLGNKELTFSDYNGGLYKYIEINGISAKNIFDPYTITFTNGNDTLSFVYCAANYYNTIVSDPDYNANAKSALQTMYNYSNAAKAVLS